MFVVLFSEQISSDFREANKEFDSFGVYTSCLYFSFCHWKRVEGRTGTYTHTYRVLAYLCGVSVLKTGKKNQTSLQ